MLKKEIFTSIVCLILLNFFRSSQASIEANFPCLVNELLREIAATWTSRPVVIPNYIDEQELTFTTLVACCSTLTSDFAGTWTTLDNLSVLSAQQITLLTTITNCCATLQTGIVPVTQIASAVTIATAGAYGLANAITGPIVIASNDVTLDLQDQVISGSTNGVIINPNVERVVVKNGHIINVAGSGVLVQSGCKSIELSYLVLSQNGSNSYPYAITCQGTAISKIQEVYVHNTSIYNSLSGILYNFVDNSIIENCLVAACVTSTQFLGYCVQGSGGTFSKGIKIKNCSVDGCSSTGSNAFGIQLNYVQSVECLESTIANLSASGSAYGMYGSQVSGLNMSSIIGENISTATGSMAVGLVLTGTLCTNIQGEDIAITTISGPIAYGIQTTGGVLATSLNAIVCSNIQGWQHATGFSIDSPAVVIKKSSVNRVISNSIAEGYNFTTNAIQCVVDTSQALNITGTGASASATGVYVQANNDAVVNCEINSILAPTAQGFWIESTAANALLENSVTTSCLGIGVLVAGTQALCYSVVSQNNSSHGFSLTGASPSLINCVSHQNGGNGISTISSNAIILACQALRSSTGILSSGTSPSIAQCFAAKNTTNYSGVSNTGTLGSLSLVAGGNLSG